ncbi:MAG: hypothetical protein WBA25_13530 [Jannaschia sp.]
MKAALAACAAILALSGPAAADHLRLTHDYDPSIVWLDAPNVTSAGHSRIRIVHDGREGAAALTPNQTWTYQNAYRRSLAHLAFRMPMRAAEPRARHHAFRAVLAAYPTLQVTGFETSPIDDGRLTPRF